MSKLVKDEKMQYDSYILISKVKRTAIMIFGGSLHFIFTLLVFDHMLAERSWTIAIFPIFVIGIGIIFLPESETWVYKPWQARPRRYERHVKDK